MASLDPGIDYGKAMADLVKGLELAITGIDAALRANGA
jgi:hypothetical protein